MVAAADYKHDNRHAACCTQKIKGRGRSALRHHHEAALSAELWPDDGPVLSFRPTHGVRCGIIGADARPNWQEQPAGLSGAGIAPWR
jgi:hypothetical protein